MKGNAYIPFMRSRGDGSTLNLDFTTGALDSRITFSRTEATVKATYINSSGYSAQVATLGDARFTYDLTTLAAKGLLIEGSAACLLLGSDFAGGTTSPTYWTYPFGGGTSAAAASSTLGNLDTARAWAQTATSARPMLSSTAITLASGTTYTASMYVESVSGGLTNQDILLMNAGTATLGTATYKNNGVTVLAGAVATVGRLETTASCTGSGTMNLRCGIGCVVTTTGSVNFSRPQVEAGTDASSFVPTTSLAVTRNADIAIIKTTNFSSWFTGGTTGTFFVDWHGGVRWITSTVRSVISTDDTATKHLHLQQVSAAGALRVGDKTPTYVTTSNSLTSGARTKGAFSFAYPGSGTTSTVNLSLNGGTVATSSSLAFSVAPTFLVLGAVSTDGSALSDTTTLLNGSIRQIKYYPTALTSAQLIAMTT